jgi:hypothetical protein
VSSVCLRGLAQRLQFVEPAVVFERHGERFEQLAERRPMAGGEGRPCIGDHHEHAGESVVGPERSGEHGTHDAGREHVPEPLVVVGGRELDRVSGLEPTDVLPPGAC